MVLRHERPVLDHADSAQVYKIRGGSGCSQFDRLEFVAVGLSSPIQHSTSPSLFHFLVAAPRWDPQLSISVSQPEGTTLAPNHLDPWDARHLDRLLCG